MNITLPAGTGGFKKNQWLQVRGQVVEPPDGERKFGVVADEIGPIERPPDASG